MNINMYRIFNKATLFLLLLFSAFQVSLAQETKAEKKQEKLEQVQNLIESKNYVFVAQNAMPLRGRTINLTSLYTFRIIGDSIIADLPYFGRAFVAPLNPSEGGIRINSSDFTYKASQKKKGGWDITITPKNAKDIRQVFLNISETGYGSLQVTSNNRQPISFSGYITDANKAR